MNGKRSIILTFDHELFLGGESGDVESCMITPTRELQKIFNEFDIKGAIFFLDTTYVDCLNRHQHIETCRQDIKKIKRNIQNLLENGHYVFPHIHPHWRDAQFIEGNWLLEDLTKYTFESCSVEERTNIWNSSMSILEEFSVGQFHSIDSFRAGGWSIQPFSIFKPYFLRHGIMNDFSVLPGRYAYTNAQKYDFTEVDQKPYYFFDEDVTKESPNGFFKEYPISTITNPKSNSFQERLLKKYLWKTNNRSIGKGQAVSPINLPYEPKNKEQNTEMVSIELIHMLNLDAYKKHLDGNEVVQFISHPKMLSNHNLKVFRNYLNYANSNYELEFDYRKLS